MPFAINTAYTDGGVGAENLARLVVKTIDERPSKQLHYVYEENDTIQDKIEKIAKGIYGAKRVVIKPSAMRKLRAMEDGEFCRYPVCIAKTQYSFSDDAKAYGVPTGFDITIRDVVINAGARMIVAIAGEIMRMPGLPKSPQAERIDIGDGFIQGLS